MNSKKTSNTQLSLCPLCTRYCTEWVCPDCKQLSCPLCPRYCCVCPACVQRDVSAARCDLRNTFTARCDLENSIVAKLSAKKKIPSLHQNSKLKLILATEEEDLRHHKEQVAGLRFQYKVREEELKSETQMCKSIQMAHLELVLQKKRDLEELTRLASEVSKRRAISVTRLFKIFSIEEKDEYFYLISGIPFPNNLDVLLSKLSSDSIILYSDAIVHIVRLVRLLSLCLDIALPFPMVSCLVENEIPRTEGRTEGGGKNCKSVHSISAEKMQNLNSDRNRRKSDGARPLPRSTGSSELEIGADLETLMKPQARGRSLIYDSVLVHPNAGSTDYELELRRYFETQFRPSPFQELKEEGPPHDRVYKCDILVANGCASEQGFRERHSPGVKVLVTSKSKDKNKAKQEASRLALEIAVREKPHVPPRSRPRQLFFDPDAPRDALRRAVEILDMNVRELCASYNPKVHQILPNLAVLRDAWSGSSNNVPPDITAAVEQLSTPLEAERVVLSEDLSRMVIDGYKQPDPSLRGIGDASIKYSSSDTMPEAWSSTDIFTSNLPRRTDSQSIAKFTGALNIKDRFF
jgi:hypothetical protein